MVTVYGLALAPLGVGALSLPVRRRLARRPLHQARRGLAAACRAWRLDPPMARGRQLFARGRVNGLRVEVGIGPDRRSEAATASIHAVAVRVQIDLKEHGRPFPPLLLDPFRDAVVHGPSDWAAVWMGLGLGEHAQPSDQLEIRGESLRFDRFLARVGPATILQTVEWIVSVVQNVRSASSIEALSRDIIQNHALARARARALTSILREHRGSELAREMAMVALSDSDPRVRLPAATYLGARGEDVLFDLALNGDEEDERLQAFCALRETGSPRLAEAADRLASDPCLRVAQQALASIEPERAVAAAMTPKLSGAHRVIALEAVEARAPGWAARTARALLDDPDLSVRTAAVDALGRCGHADDLAAIRRAGARAPAGSGLFIACRAALELIRDRVRAESGRISIVGHPSGRGNVSIASVASGTKKPRGPQTSG